MLWSRCRFVRISWIWKHSFCSRWSYNYEFMTLLKYTYASAFATGIMEISLLKTLLNSITCFDLLSSSNPVKSELVQRYFRKIDEILEILNPVLDQAVSSDISSDGKLIQLLKELDGAVNEARELVGCWHPMMSKVYFVCYSDFILETIFCKILFASITRKSVIQITF